MQTKSAAETARALRLPGVCELTGLSRASVWRLSRQDADFPKPFRLSRATTAWCFFEVVDWIERRKAERV